MREEPRPPGLVPGGNGLTTTASSSQTPFPPGTRPGGNAEVILRLTRRRSTTASGSDESGVAGQRRQDPSAGRGGRNQKHLRDLAVLPRMSDNRHRLVSKTIRPADRSCRSCAFGGSPCVPGRLAGLPSSLTLAYPRWTGPCGTGLPMEALRSLAVQGAIGVAHQENDRCLTRPIGVA